MNFRNKSGVRLGGASKKEASKEELLRQVRVERNLRAKARDQNAAAVCIQRMWRGHSQREKAGKDRFSAWMQAFGGVAADPDTLLSAIQIYDEVIPCVLQTTIPEFSRARKGLEEHGTQLGAKEVVDPIVIRGALAIVLRSMGSEVESTNYSSLCSHADKQGSWQYQCIRLLMLCAGIVGSSELMYDHLLQAACAQLLLTISDELNWKCYQPRDALSGSSFTKIIGRFAREPAPYMSLRRLLLPKKDIVLEQLNNVVTFSRIVEWMMTVSVRLLDAASEGTEHCSHFARLVMSLPCMWIGLSNHMRAGRLSAARVSLTNHMSKLMTVAREITWLNPSDCVSCTGNICALFAGEKVIRQRENGQQINFLVSSVALENSSVAMEYMDNASRLLITSSRNAAISPIDGETWVEAVRTLGMFADRMHMLQLLNIAERTEDGIRAFSDLYFGLLHNIQSPLSKKSHPVSLQFLNVLAFAPSFIPKMWYWIANNLHVPLEAHIDAARGWKIQSVQGGLKLLETSHSRALCLFCEAYAHLLQVLDDEDFHEAQEPLTLAQNRAVATTLNTLVFFTHCKQDNPENGPSSLSCTDIQLNNITTEYAHLLLRRLYERDARRSFCRSSLWLGPYSECQNGMKGEDFLAASVVQALINKTSGRMSGGPSISTSKAMGMANVLLSAPHCIPFDDRVQVFRGLVAADREANRWDLPPIEGGPPPIQVTIRRSQLFNDALSSLSNLGAKIRGKLMVTFVDDHGIEEPGMDLGGLMKEMVEEVMKTGLNPDAGLFQANDNGLLYPSPLAEQLPCGPMMLKFLGQILGKALYEGMLLDIPLAPFFLLQLQARTLMFDDLFSLDPDLHRSLLQVKRFSGDASDLGLDFTVEADLLGKHVVEELVAGGSDKTVTNENKLQYVHLMADWHVNVKVGRPAQAFAAGFAEVLPLPWLRLFSPKELNALLSGGDGVDIDIQDLKEHTQYSGGYSKSSQAIGLLWKALSSFSTDERASFLKFITSCSRPPLGGFKHMQPPLTVHKVDCSASPLALVGGKDVELLPSASTCYNMLKLPNYRRLGTLRKKLLLAIQSNTGFGFS